MPMVSVIFIGIFFILIAIPCVGIGWIGFRLLTKLGHFPSKTPALQLSILFKLAIVEIVSWTLLLLFFKILVSN